MDHRFKPGSAPFFATLAWQVLWTEHLVFPIWMKSMSDLYASGYACLKMRMSKGCFLLATKAKLTVS